MKIGFFTEMYYPKIDGVVISVDTFKRELEKLGHEVYIFAPSPNLRYKESDPSIIRFPAIKGLWFDEYMTKFPWTPQNYKRAKELKLDIVHIHTPSELGIFGMSLALKENIPLVTTYHTDLFEYAKHYPQTLPGVLLLIQLLPFFVGKPSLFKATFSAMKPERSIDKWNQKIVLKMVPALNNLCNLVIAPSEKIKKQMLRWKTTAPVEVLPTGIEQLSASAEGLARFKSEYGITEKDKVILYIGRLAPEKNIELLISAFAKISPRVKDAKLLLVGDDAHKKKLHKFVHTHGLNRKVIFTGYIKDRTLLGAAYAASDVFAFPSVTDTQGLVVGEAALMGLPVVMVDKGITETVVDGQNGFYAKNNPTDFAAKLITILENDALRRRMSKASQKLAASVTSHVQTLKLEKLYKNLLQVPSKSS